MEERKNGYIVDKYEFATKRYCQTLELNDDSALIEEYKRRHSPSQYWKEVGEGIKSVGILEMDIFLIGNRLFMIVETLVDFDWDKAFAKLSQLPRQAEWENEMSIFQKTLPNAASAEKWQLMERIFSL